MIRLFLVLSALLLAACGGAPPPVTTSTLPPATVTVAVAGEAELTAVEPLPGTVRPAVAATLMARVPGVVARVRAQPGQVVAEGEVLIELDAQEIAAKRDQAAAAAAAAAADFARIGQLFAEQRVTKAEFDGAKARADGTAAAAAEAGIMLSYTVIRAPFAGRVVRRHAEAGDLLAPGRPVVELEDPTSMRLEVEVPETLAVRLEPGARLRAVITAASFDGEAEVVEVIPAADPVTRTILAKLALPPTATALRTGHFGRVEVPVAGAPLLTVPASAIVRRGQLDAVFVVTDGRAKMRLVRTGRAASGLIAIRAGLAAGESVVTDGADTLADGQPVVLR